MKVVGPPRSPQAGLEAREEGGMEGGERFFEEEGDGIVGRQELGVPRMTEKPFSLERFFYVFGDECVIFWDTAPL